MFGYEDEVLKLPINVSDNEINVSERQKEHTGVYSWVYSSASK